MAEGQEEQERSQEPTQKKLDDAHERGDVVKSMEVNTWFVLAGGTLVLLAFSGPTAASLGTTMRGLIANSGAMMLDGATLLRLVQRIGIELALAAALPLLVLMLAAACGSMIQHRLVWSFEPLKPRLSKISPVAGLKRLFSKQALANFLKGLVKLALIGAVMTALLWPHRHRLEGLIATDPGALLPFTRLLAIDLLLAAVAIMAFVAAGDYLFQYRQWYEKQKMSIQELREEFKQTEGSPLVKAKFKQLRHSRMKKRMMAAVPTATVIITNPTHYAVALRYERGMNAPVCVAKGVDLLARRIREVAGAHAVPIVENAPLARALHAAVDIDEEIPPEHYQAVAEVIGYVMRLRRAVAR
jgi:flagellar biosynthetic protein FlhB